MSAYLLLSSFEQRKSALIDGVDYLSHLEHFVYGESYEKYFDFNTQACFSISRIGDELYIDSSYYVGVDWVVKDKIAVYIQPKLNQADVEINFIQMLMDSLDHTENFDHLEHLIDIDHDSPWISVPNNQDILSPLLVVQFLKLVQHIVRKGLKKSYYKVRRNLNNRVKGKVLVGQQLKRNILKNRITHTVCEFEEYGVDFEENQYLKSVLEFVSHYINEANTYFTKQQKDDLTQILSYCKPAFEQIRGTVGLHKKIHVRKNVFYKDYEEAIRIGGLILKRFSYTVSLQESAKPFARLPPFWIDMSKLFELYVFAKLKAVFPGSDEITYHDRFLGNKETDILIRTAGYQCVVDCKYKPQYADNTPSLEDKRQLAGYTRLKSVYNKLGVSLSSVVKGVIIYSNQMSSSQIEKEELFSDKNKMGEYVDFYKIGVSLPEKRS